MVKLDSTDEDSSLIKNCLGHKTAITQMNRHKNTMYSPKFTPFAQKQNCGNKKELHLTRKSE